jgi:tetratricopeptide (TPR) repeat protein
MSDSKESSQERQEIYHLIDRCIKKDNDAMDRLLDVFLLMGAEIIKDKIVDYIKEKDGAYRDTLLGFVELWFFNNGKEAEQFFINSMKECVYAYVGMSYVYIHFERINADTYAQRALKSGCNFAYMALSRYEYKKGNYDKSLEYASKSVEHGVMFGYFGQGKAYAKLEKEKEAFECYYKALKYNCQYSKKNIKKHPNMMGMLFDMICLLMET